VSLHMSRKAAVDRLRGGSGHGGGNDSEIYLVSPGRESMSWGTKEKVRADFTRPWQKTGEKQKAIGGGCQNQALMSKNARGSPVANVSKPVASLLLSEKIRTQFASNSQGKGTGWVGDL